MCFNKMHKQIILINSLIAGTYSLQNKGSVLPMILEAKPNKGYI